MRVIAAGCFVFGGLLGLVALGGATGVFENGPQGLIALVFTMGFLVLVAVALLLFNRRMPSATKSGEEHLRELEALGLLDGTDFRATRAFGVEESEDEGLHYYLELSDGRVLFLSGQYLYNLEPTIDDPDLNRPRRFPCSEFTIRRHAKEGYVADIQCRGVVLEPEILAPPFSENDWDANRVPEDGQIISDRTYETLRHERVGASRGHLA